MLPRGKILARLVPSLLGVLLSPTMRASHAAVVRTVPKYSCNDLGQRLRELVAVHAPDDFKVLIATDRVLIGREQNLSPLGEIGQTFRVLDRERFDDVGRMTVRLYDPAAPRTPGPGWQMPRPRPLLEIHPLIFPAYRGRGYSTEAQFALLGYGFDALGAHASPAQIFRDNPASVALHEKLGFQFRAQQSENVEYWLSHGDFLALQNEIARVGLRNFFQSRRAPESFSRSNKNGEAP